MSAMQSPEGKPATYAPAAAMQRDLLFDALPVVFYTCTLAGRPTWLSAAFERVTGLTPEPFLRDDQAFSARVHPGDRDERRRSARLLLERGSASVEYRWQCGDGAYRWFAEGAQLVRGLYGEPIAVAGVWLEVEAPCAPHPELDWTVRYDAVQRAAGTMSYYHDLATDHVTYGGDVEASLGWTAEELAGDMEHLRSFVHPDDWDAATAEWERAVATGGAYHGEFRMRHQDGSWRLVRDDSMVLQDAAGRGLCAIGTIRDVTELRAVQARLQARLQALEAEQRALDGRQREQIAGAQDLERASIAALLHDEVGAILTQLQLCLVVKDRAHGGLEEALQMVRLAQTRVGDLSHLLHPPELDTTTLWATVRRYVCHAGDNLRPEIVATCSGVEPELTPVVKRHLYGIVQEAVQNALKHAHATQVQVRFGWSATGLVLEVEDDGCGIGQPRRVGLGTRSIRDRAVLLGGEVQWLRNTPRGTTLQLRMALAAAARLAPPEQG